MKKLLYLFTAILALILPAGSLAGVYYVSTSGNDVNDGTITAPWATLSRAIYTARGGDSVYVRGGNYAESEIWISANYGMGGSDGHYMTISAYPGELPIFTNGNRPFIISANYVRVQGLEFRDGKEIAISNDYGWLHNIEVLNNRFTGQASWAAIEAFGDSLLIQGNLITLEGNKVGTQGHGIYLMRGSHNIIRGNTISGMVGYGIHVFDQSRAASDFQIALTDLLIEGNTIFHSLERSGIIVATQDTAEVKRVTIRNNILYDLAGSGMLIQNDVSDIKVYNNTIYNVNTDQIDWNGQEGIIISDDGMGHIPKNIEIYNNIIYTLDPASSHIANYNGRNVLVRNNLYWPMPLKLVNVEDSLAVKEDPRLEDPQGAHFSLRQNSPAIDRGIDMGMPFKGKAPDLGAIEYTEGTSIGALMLEATYSSGAIHLHWRPVSGRTIRGFEVERSTSQLDYTKIAFIDYAMRNNPEPFFRYDDPVGESSGKYSYRLKIILANGEIDYTPAVTVLIQEPEHFELLQNRPNPFNDSTEISYILPESAHVSIIMYNLSGQEIVRLADREVPRGTHRITWNGVDAAGKHLASGIYICQLKNNRACISKKLLLLR